MSAAQLPLSRFEQLFTSESFRIDFQESTSCDCGLLLRISACSRTLRESILSSQKLRSVILEIKLLKKIDISAFDTNADTELSPEFFVRLFALVIPTMKNANPQPPLETSVNAAVMTQYVEPLSTEIHALYAEILNNTKEGELVKETSRFLKLFHLYTDCVIPYEDLISRIESSENHNAVIMALIIAISRMKIIQTKGMESISLTRSIFRNYQQLKISNVTTILLSLYNNRQHDFVLDVLVHLQETSSVIELANCLLIHVILRERKDLYNSALEIVDSLESPELKQFVLSIIPCYLAKDGNHEAATHAFALFNEHLDCQTELTCVNFAVTLAKLNVVTHSKKIAAVLETLSSPKERDKLCHTLIDLTNHNQVRELQIAMKFARLIQDPVQQDLAFAKISYFCMRRRTDHPSRPSQKSFSAAMKIAAKMNNTQMRTAQLNYLPAYYMESWSSRIEELKKLRLKPENLQPNPLFLGNLTESWTSDYPEDTFGELMRLFQGVSYEFRSELATKLLEKQGYKAHEHIFELAQDVKDALNNTKLFTKLAVLRLTQDDTDAPFEAIEMAKNLSKVEKSITAIQICQALRPCHFRQPVGEGSFIERCRNAVDSLFPSSEGNKPESVT